MPSLAEKNACELLDADHIAVKHLFVEYARLAAADAAGADRKALAAKICSDLTVHAAIEEEIFYPALREAVPAAAPLLDEAGQEHQEAKDLIARIQGMTSADAAMDDLVAKLNAAIEHHVKEERDELFPKARSAPSLDLQALADTMRERQRELQGTLPAPA